MTDNVEAINRANRAKQAMDEFIKPAFDIERAGYALTLADVAAKEPWAVDKIRNLAMAIKVLDGVQAQVMAVVANGTVAEFDMRRAAQIAAIPSRKRGFLGLG